MYRLFFELSIKPKFFFPIISGDPKSNLHLWFSTKDDAIAYCERNGFHYEVDETHERRKLKKTYAENFSWNKRTRVGSK